MTNQFGKNLKEVRSHMRWKYTTDHTKLVSLVDMRYDDKRKTLTILFSANIDLGSTRHTQLKMTFAYIPDQSPIQAFQLQEL